jgi:hypothetical protein
MLSTGAKARKVWIRNTKGGCGVAPQNHRGKRLNRKTKSQHLVSLR